jgi:hypothetical protein
MAVLILVVLPGDADYNRLHDLWVRDGRGHLLEDRFHEKIWRAEFPDGGADPQFLLLVSLPGATSPDLTAPLSGEEMAMMAYQRTWHGNRLLPKV